jgi:hypothetical protein
MKFLRTTFIGAVVLGIIIFLSGSSFAQEECHAGKMGHETKVKLLKDSALALQQSHPELAKGLNDYANKEAKEMQEWKARHEAAMKLIKDAAVALQQSNPDLAKGLQEMCKGKPNSEMQNMMQEKNEKEEVGEKVEPKSEQGENTK